MICKWEDCNKPLDYGGRGRKPMYCPEHKALAKQAKDDARRGTVRVVMGPLRPCCHDAIVAGVIGYGPDGSYHIRKAKKQLRKCPQCKTCYRFGNEQRKQDLVTERNDKRSRTLATKITGTKENLGMEWVDSNSNPGSDQEKIATLAEELGDIGEDGGRAYQVWDAKKYADEWKPWKRGINRAERKLDTIGDRWLAQADQLDWVAYVMACCGLVRERYQNTETLAE